MAEAAQVTRARGRDARLAKARERRRQLEKGREARDARLEQAVADVYLGQEERDQAVAAVDRAEARIGEAIARILAEGVVLSQVAELTDLSVNQVQRLRAAAPPRETRPSALNTKGTEAPAAQQETAQDE